MANIPALFAGNTNLPAHLRGAAAAANELAEHYSAGFKVLSIKGKNWTIVSGEDKTVLMNPLDPDSPASSIEVVIVAASPHKNKVWYAGAYVDGAEVGKPDCFSTNGETPDPSVEKPQSKKCAICPKNQWGSKISTDGTASKGKACNDTIRMAVSAPNDIANPLLLRIPPASIKAAGEYGALLAKRGVPLQAVLTKLKFDKDAPTPKVMFEPVGFLDEAQYTAAMEAKEGDIAQAILASEMVGVAEPESKPADPLDAVPEHLKPKDTPPAEPAAEAPAEKTPEQLAEEEEECQLQALLAKKAAKTASGAITKAKEVTPAEVAAAVQAGEAGATVATAAKVATPKATKPAKDAPAGNIEIDAGSIPDLSSIDFDD
jgi:hypothetical protein